MHLRSRIPKPLAILALVTPALAALAGPLATAAGLEAGAATDGAWQCVGPPSPRAQATVVFDAAHDRLVAFGGWDGAYRNDAWMMSLASPGEWVALRPAGALPPPRSSHVAVYDGAGGRMLVFGGRNDAGPLGDVWALSLGDSPAWTPLAPSGPAPTPRFGHAAALDAARNRLVVFGGDDDGVTLLEECWTLSLGASPAWAPLATSGPGPGPRSRHTAVVDVPRDRLIVLGGFDGAAVLGDARALDLASGHWSAFTPSGPAPAARTGHVAVFDAVANRMVVHGGFDGALPHEDAWSVNLAGSPAWTALAPSGPAPSARSGHAAAFDGPRERLVVFGGDDGARRDDACALSLAGGPAWSVLAAPPSPSARYRHVAMPDPLGRALVFGGFDGTATYPAGTWAQADATGPWSTLAVPPPAPAGRYAHTLVWDPIAERAIVFGGHDGLSRLSDAWSLATGATAAWAPLAPSGTAPSARQNHTAVRDARRGRRLVFGGYDGARRDDTWALALEGAAAWEPLAPLGTPPSPRGNHAAVYDPVRDRMLVIGGSDGAYRNDVWELALSGVPEWRPLAVLGTPPSPRVGHSAVYDPVRDRVVLFGGDDLAFRADAWALSLAGTPAWTELAPGGAVPPGRRFHAAFYDPWRDALWIHGGWNGDYRADGAELVWGSPARPWAEGPGALTVAAGATVPATLTLRHGLGGPRAVEWRLGANRAWPGWPLHGFALVGALPDSVPLAVPVPDSAAGGVVTLRLLVGFVGAEGYDSVTTHALTVLPRSTAVGAEAGAPFAIEALGPNPGRGPFTLSFRAPRAGEAEIEWFDVGGRRAAPPRAEHLAAGVSALALEPPAGAHAGLHLVRVRFGGETATARVVVLR